MVYAKHLCQHCGCDRKWVQTLIDDERFWNEDLEGGKGGRQPNGFSDDFSHTGVETCCECGKARTGA